jgi:alpha-glucuronidase
MLLQMQEGIAVKCKDGCVLYFPSFSKLPIPEGLEKPEHDLEYFLDYESR